jgi:hypothetical protein
MDGMSDEPEDTREEGTREGVSRRRVLKGIAAAGAVAWATPVVQTVNMQRAWAENGSPERVCYRIKIESDGTCDEGIGNNDCLTTDGFESDGGCTAAAPITLTKDLNDPDCKWTITVNPNCVITEATAKTGNECHENLPGTGTNTINIDTCLLDDQGISHVELVVCCEQPA